ncbi:hypothetical protein [Cupriavidus basilensis]|uniref:hypothetical protein n=1 Tax=Cupriavidus basilensis TaxID=68895 RepID=UPI0011849081|nr:hypothetical protein [Cupriavidus basilensis]
MPSFDDALIEPTSPAVLLREELDSMHLNRKSRRKHEQEFFDSRGGLRSSAYKRLRSLALTAEQHAADQFPMTPAALRDVIQYSLGIGSRETAIKGIRDSMADLECFADWYAKQWERVAPVSLCIREIGESLMESLLALAQEVSGLCEGLANAGEPSDAVATGLRDVFTSLLRNQPRSLVRRLAAAQGITVGDAFDCSWENAPTLMTVANVMCHLGRRSALLPQRHRKPLASDFGDILHTVYVPHVDIFRADGFMANTISEAKLPLKTTVVGKFLNLPSAIERRLQG